MTEEEKARLSAICNSLGDFDCAWLGELVWGQVAELERMRGALTPSAETKAAFIGEFEFAIESDMDDSRVTVPWTTVKEIMKAIRARAALQPSSTGKARQTMSISDLHHAIDSAGECDPDCRACLSIRSETRREVLEEAAKELESHCVVRKPGSFLKGMPYHDSCPDCRGARIIRALASPTPEVEPRRECRHDWEPTMSGKRICRRCGKPEKPGLKTRRYCGRVGAIGTQDNASTCGECGVPWTSHELKPLREPQSKSEAKRFAAIADETHRPVRKVEGSDVTVNRPGEEQT